MTDSNVRPLNPVGTMETDPELIASLARSVVKLTQQSETPVVDYLLIAVHGQNNYSTVLYGNTRCAQMIGILESVKADLVDHMRK